VGRARYRSRGSIKEKLKMGLLTERGEEGGWKGKSRVKTIEAS